MWTLSQMASTQLNEQNKKNTRVLEDLGKRAFENIIRIAFARIEVKTPQAQGQKRPSFEREGLALYILLQFT